MNEFEKEIFMKVNFREMTGYDLEQANIPKHYWDVDKKDIQPNHLKLIKDYVLSWKIKDEGGKSPRNGFIFTGDVELCMKYASIILQRVYMRKRSIYCRKVFTLEQECKDYDRLKSIANYDLLVVYEFPFFIYGAPLEQMNLCVTNFHQMISYRYNNDKPTIYVCSSNFEKLTESYAGFPIEVINSIFKVNPVVELETSKS